MLAFGLSGERSGVTGLWFETRKSVMEESKQLSGACPVKLERLADLALNLSIC